MTHVYCFRVLLRVRLLYYLKQEVVGDEAEKVFSGLPARYACLPQFHGVYPCLARVILFTVGRNSREIHYYPYLCVSLSPCLSLNLSFALCSHNSCHLILQPGIILLRRILDDVFLCKNLRHEQLFRHVILSRICELSRIRWPNVSFL